MLVHSSVLIWDFFAHPLRLSAYFAVKKPLKQLTAKSAKNAKITQRVELRTLLWSTMSLYQRSIPCTLYNQARYDFLVFVKSTSKLRKAELHAYLQVSGPLHRG